MLMAIIQLLIGVFSKNNKIIFFINAIVSAAFGALIIWFKFEDERSLTALVGIYTAILGITILYYAIRLKIWSGQRLKLAEENVLTSGETESVEEIPD